MDDIEKLVADLKQKRDEVKLKIHLGSKDLQDEFADLEEKWDKFAAEAKIGHSASEIGDAAKDLGTEIGKAYDRIKNAL